MFTSDMPLPVQAGSLGVLADFLSISSSAEQSAAAAEIVCDLMQRPMSLAPEALSDDPWGPYLEGSESSHYALAAEMPADLGHEDHCVERELEASAPKVRLADINK